MSNTFQKTERLTGRKVFDTLFRDGNSFFMFPFRVIYMESTSEMPFPARVAFAVPKKNFKRAVDRNHIKRICRESYRRHKQPFYDALTAQNRKLLVLFVFLHKSPISLAECDDKIVLTLQRLIKAKDGAGDRKKT